MRLLDWGGRNGKGESKWEGGEFVGGPLLIYLLEVIDAISFCSVGVLGESGKILWEQPLRLTC